MTKTTFHISQTRPKGELLKNPARKDIVLKPVVTNRFLEENKNIDPRKR